MMAGLIVSTMVNAVMDILDLPAGRPEDELAMVSVLEKQLRLILLGASQWKSA
jgi:TetR/AcrR family transcriptional regulator, fatty acid biosynthesis regulator